MMKSPLLFICLLLIFSCSVFAQSPNAARAMKSTEKIAKAITLKEGQYEQINNAYLTLYRKMDNMKGRDESGQLVDPLEERNQMIAEFDQSLASILDEQQLAEWKIKEAELLKMAAPRDHKERLQEKINNASARKAQRLSKDLGLTQEQQTKVYDAYLLHMTSIMELRTEGKSETTPDKKEIDARLEATLDSILTEEQKKKQEALVAERNAKREQLKLTRLEKQTQQSEQIHQKALSESKNVAARLELTPEQESQYLGAALTKFAGLQKLNEASKKEMNTEELEATKQKINQEFEKQLKAILTPEQAEKLKARAE